jgi:ubiquitin C-terminal hydrolase
MKINGVPQDETDTMAIRCYTMMKNVYQKDYSEIVKLFFGIHVSQILTPKTENVLSNSPEPYFVVELPIPNQKSISLYDCFRFYSQPEQLEGDNAWYNEKTQKKENVEKRMVFWSFPEILVIALKRFTNMNRKLNQRVDAPLTALDLGPFVKGYNKESFKYDLFGVGNHVGNALGGHYFAYIKGESGQWYEMNDTNVKPLKESEIISQKAYVFFYKLIK